MSGVFYFLRLWQSVLFSSISPTVETAEPAGCTCYFLVAPRLGGTVEATTLATHDAAHCQSKQVDLGSQLYSPCDVLMLLILIPAFAGSRATFDPGLSMIWANQARMCLYSELEECLIKEAAGKREKKNDRRPRNLFSEHKHHLLVREEHCNTDILQMRTVRMPSLYTCRQTATAHWSVALC